MNRMDTPYIGADVAPNPRAKGVPLTPWPWTGDGAKVMEERAARGLIGAEKKNSIHPKPNRVKNRIKQDRGARNRTDRAEYNASHAHAPNKAR